MSHHIHSVGEHAGTNDGQRWGVDVLNDGTLRDGRRLVGGVSGRWHVCNRIVVWIRVSGESGWRFEGLFDRLRTCHLLGSCNRMAGWIAPCIRTSNRMVSLWALKLGRLNANPGADRSGAERRETAPFPTRFRPIWRRSTAMQTRRRRQTTSTREDTRGEERRYCTNMLVLMCVSIYLLSSACFLSSVPVLGFPCFSSFRLSSSSSAFDLRWNSTYLPLVADTDTARIITCHRKTKRPTRQHRSQPDQPAHGTRRLVGETWTNVKIIGLLTSRIEKKQTYQHSIARKARICNCIWAKWMGTDENLTKRWPPKLRSMMILLASTFLLVFRCYKVLLRCTIG